MRYLQHRKVFVKLSGTVQRRIQNPVNYLILVFLRSSWWLSAINYFCNLLNLRCLAGTSVLFKQKFRKFLKFWWMFDDSNRSYIRNDRREPILSLFSYSLLARSFIFSLQFSWILYLLLVLTRRSCGHSNNASNI